MEASRCQDIYVLLQTNSIDVYFPAEHEGECTAPYTVVKNAGGSNINNTSSQQYLYDIMCYVPKNQYSKLEPYVAQVKTLMAQLYPMVIPTGTETPSFYDDSVKAQMISVTYRNSRLQI